MTEKADTSADANETKEWSTLFMLAVCLGFGGILAAIFLNFPQIDLWVADIFYKGDNDFWLRKTAFNLWSNEVLRPAIGWIAVGALLTFIIRWLTIPMYRVRSLARYGFFFICVILATGFVVHAVFKDNWGRARPKHVVEFAGNYEFTPPLIIADQCERNCSFVSGDASLGYVFLALALYARRHRKFWILVTIGAGLGLGALRMMNGSHFLSDILFSGVITNGTVLLLYRWLEEKKFRKDMRFILPPVVWLWDYLSDLLPWLWIKLKPRMTRLFED